MLLYQKSLLIVLKLPSTDQQEGTIFLQSELQAIDSTVLNSPDPIDWIIVMTLRFYSYCIPSTPMQRYLIGHLVLGPGAGIGITPMASIIRHYICNKVG